MSCAEAPDQKALGEARYWRFAEILRRRGTEIGGGTVLVDFGCGSGHLVKAALDRGVDAFGCDVDFDQPAYDQEVLSELRSANRVREVETDRTGSPGADRLPIGEVAEPFGDYRLPFDDATVDVVVSSEVLEHVANYRDVVRELHRIMKPGAVFVHMFPPRYAILESHTNIPFGGGFKPDWWLKLWSRAGMRIWHKKGCPADEYYTWTRHYLDNCVYYLTKRELIEAFSGSFDLEFVERELFEINPRTKIFALPVLYSHFRGRIMYGVRRSEDSGEPV